MDIKIMKMHENAVVPEYKTEGACGADLTAVSIKYLGKNDEEIFESDKDFRAKLQNVSYGLGLAFEIPVGYGLFLFPRSSCYKHELVMSNCVGVVDSDYRGEVSVVFFIGFTSIENIYKVGERCCQAVIMPITQANFILSDKLSETKRGVGGYGSTGV